MASWIPITPVDSPKMVVEIRPGALEPIEVYRERYMQELPGPGCWDTAERTNREIYDFFEQDSSVLLLGSGHSFWANQTMLHPNINHISVLDLVAQSGYNLDSRIRFFHFDILDYDIPVISDYIYSAHTVEHFSRDQIFQRVLSECQKKARKAVDFLVPFEDHWAEDLHHKCLFYEGDELFNRASRYKIIRDGQELVLWFEGKAI